MTRKETQQETPDAPTLEDALGEAMEHAGVAPPSLREKLSRVAAHCAYVQKGGVNEFHGYPYAMASQVFAKVNEALEANRLVSVPAFFLEPQESSAFAMIRCRLELHDLDSGETLWTTAFGSGADKGDKAVMKAQTAALKYAWMMLLNISTGDDPEADSTTDSRASGEPIKPRQTPEEYAARVERNKAAKLSPLGEKAMELADLSPALKESIQKVREEKETRKPKGDWPGEAPPVEAYVDLNPEEVYVKEQRKRFMEAVGGVEECPCGSPLVERHASKAKGGYAYMTCEASDKAFKAGTKLKGDHTWKRVP